MPKGVRGAIPKGKGRAGDGQRRDVEPRVRGPRLPPVSPRTPRTPRTPTNNFSIYMYMWLTAIAVHNP